MADAEVLNPASKFSLAKERMLQKLGAHEKSKDQAYLESKEKISQLEDISADVTTVLKMWFKKVCELSTASISLSKVWLRIYEGTDERMESVARAYSKKQENIKNNKIPKLADRIEEFNEEINKYVDGVGVIKGLMESRRKFQLSYDHYNAKYLKLKAQQQKNRGSGKLETLKQRDRFERNTQKLNSAKSAFLKANQTVIKSMHHHWESRFAFLDNLFKQVLMNETMFFESFAKTLCSTRPLLYEALKKPLPKPSAPPSQEEMNELNDKVKYGNQTLFVSNEDGPSNSLEGNQDNSPLSLEERVHSSSIGSITGKVSAGIKLGTNISKAKNLLSKKKVEKTLEFGNSKKESLTLDDNSLEEKAIQFNDVKEVKQKQTEINPEDPFAIFDSSSKQGSSIPVAKTAQSNPFDKAEVRSVEDPFSVLAHSQDSFSGQEAKINDPFSNVSKTPNPFAGEKSEGDLSGDKPYEDPFAAFFS